MRSASLLCHTKRETVGWKHIMDDLGKCSCCSPAACPDIFQGIFGEGLVCPEPHRGNKLCSLWHSQWSRISCSGLWWKWDFIVSHNMWRQRKSYKTSLNINIIQLLCQNSEYIFLFSLGCYPSPYDSPSSVLPVLWGLKSVFLGQNCVYLFKQTHTHTLTQVPRELVLHDSVRPAAIEGFVHFLQIQSILCKLD